MHDEIRDYLKLKGYSGNSLNREVNRTVRGIEANEKAAEAVAGTVFSVQVFKYKCGECGEKHFTKEIAVQTCPGRIE